MNYPLTEQQLSSLASNWTSDLQSALQSAGHIETGRLSNSIRVSFKKTSNGFEIDMNSLGYIRYLDNGMFLKNFLQKKQKEMVSILNRYMKEDLQNQIKDINNKIKK